MTRSGRQLDLLTDWEPPVAAVRFDEDRVRASTAQGHISRALAASLKDCRLPRVEIAQRMSEFLGETFSKNMLDAYASQAREEHSISLVRFIALLHATRDRRLLEMIAERLGWSVIERKHLPLIELAAVQDRAAELQRHADALRRKARQGGAL